MPCNKLVTWRTWFEASLGSSLFSRKVHRPTRNSCRAPRPLIGSALHRPRCHGLRFPALWVSATIEFDAQRIEMTDQLSHVSEDGAAHMVDVSTKTATLRRA